MAIEKHDKYQDARLGIYVRHQLQSSRIFIFFYQGFEHNFISDLDGYG